MKYIQIHELVAYPASNLNRDDLGRPKTVKIGDSTRLRISSQSLKRAWRTSEKMSQTFPVMGIRTNELDRAISNALQAGVALPDYIFGDGKSTRQPVEKKIADRYGNDIDMAFRAKKSSKSEDADAKDEDDTKKGNGKKKQILHYTDTEIRNADAIMEAVSRGESPKIENLFSGAPFPVDMAMFGRMVANNTDYNCDAAVQVAHAFTVHKAQIEDDFFTAVDDLNRDDQGSAHMGETGFGAGLFYNYICVDFELLSKNLGSEEEAHKALDTLLEVSATVSPTGKQNSFASRAYASYVMIEKGDRP